MFTPIIGFTKSPMPSKYSAIAMVVIYSHQSSWVPVPAFCNHSLLSGEARVVQLFWPGMI